MITAVPDLADLESLVVDALATGDESHLHVLGYGEISTVIAWPDADGPHACKRLPIFDDAARFSAYRSLFGDYIRELRSRGVAVHESHLDTVPRDDGRVVAYCVQPVLARDSLAPRLLASCDDATRERVVGEICDRLAASIGPAVGIDAQLSNWAVVADELVYLDITTPLLRDEDGEERLDTELFMASLPAALRPIVRRFLLGSILDPYYTPRRAALDLTGNLYKEGLGELVPSIVAVVNQRLGSDLTVDEIRAHYRSDARMWSLLQRARRIDRAWQRHVRRRPYPFLLPGPVDRGL